MAGAPFHFRKRPVTVRNRTLSDGVTGAYLSTRNESGWVGMRGRTRRHRAVVALVVALLVVTGCSSGGGADGAAGTADSAAVEEFTSADAAPADGDDAVGGSERAGAGRSQVQTRAVISTGQVELQADDLGELRGEIDRLLGRFGGYIAREETRNDEEGRTSSATMQLRVPAQHFDTMMGSFAEVATVLNAGRKAEDVTTEVIDVASRIRTQEISLERLRTFLGRATKVADMIRLEAEIAEREADLSSLRAQQDFLDDQTSLATINVRMTLPGEEVEQEDPLADAGFLTGLRNGWAALGDIAVIGATAVGALLPFLGLLALLVLPLVGWLRITRRRRRTPAPPAS